MQRPTTTDEIREAFVRFFVERQHREIESAPLVPHDDPSLLFTGAGMVPFKPYFMGRATPPQPRLTTVQRCFRTVDIEEVGDTTHHTFFEMLGNFSVGDYFKDDAIRWSWEFCTGVLGIDPARLWITVYEDDDEAFDLWRGVGVPEERILRYTAADGNFWDTGAGVGPCGPCSELHYDFGEEFGRFPEVEPKNPGRRFLEIWNLVFMTYLQNGDGTVSDLPKKNIDTGAGLERVAMAVQGRRSTYETDGLSALLDAAGHIARINYGENPDADRALRAIVDHSRAVSFLIADGVLPSNEGRGYVLRRVLRRAVYFGRKLGMPTGFMEQMAGEVLDRFGAHYSFLRRQERLVRTTIAREESSFRETLERGLARLDELLERHQGAGVLPGDEVFRLYDTYGVPRELAAEVAAGQGLTIDLAGYEQAREAAREIARAASSARFRTGTEDLAGAFAQLAGQAERFHGYDHLRLDTHITGIIRDGRLVERAEEGDEVLLMLSETPLYPEGGGQMGDSGVVHSDTGRITVHDTRRDTSGVIYHQGVLVSGYVSVNDQARAEVDVARRRDSARNHTGTHLLHASLRSVLGEHVHQRGSLVAPDRLRFDFNHLEAPNPDQLDQVRALVNERVRSDTEVRTRETSIDEARAQGVMAIFGEKYGERVRVVEIPDDAGSIFSAELCGGTHVHDTGEIGSLHILSEASIGSGLRRVEALTGATAERWVSGQLRLLENASRRAGVNPSELEHRIVVLQDELAEERRQLEALQREAGRRTAGSLAEQAEDVDGVRLLVAAVDAPNADAMRQMGDQLRQSLGASVVVLGAVMDGKPRFMVMARDAGDGFDARSLLNGFGPVAGAKGGGRPDMAQGGGTDAAKLTAALEAARSMAREQLRRGQR